MASPLSLPSYCIKWITCVQVTSDRGPAMSDSMYAIGWLQMKEFDRAYSNFKKMYEHVAGDFQVRVCS